MVEYVEAGEMKQPCAGRTNVLKPATINHYLHRFDHNSFFFYCLSSQQVEINELTLEIKKSSLMEV